MKFFEFIQVSSFQIPSWVYPDDAPDTPVPSHRLYYLYSKHHSLLPKSDVPNTSCPIGEIPAEVDESFDPSISSPDHLYSTKVDSQCGCVHDLCSQHLLISEHSQHRKSGQPGLDIEFEYLPSKQDNGISLPKQCGLSYNLLYGSSFDMFPYCKAMNFIETKVAAINCRVLTIN